ncbi:MAG: hypothetical protein WCH43_07045 [Verrucomicrobiota bacterium]
MNSDHSHSSTCQGPFIPFLLIALSLVVLSLWQIKSITGDRTEIQAMMQQQTEPVNKSKQVQAGLEKIVLELLQLARDGDPDAKAIVAKYNISQQAPGTAAPSPVK